MNAADVVAIRNILVATDFSRCSDQAVRAALALARHFGASVHLLHVVPSTAPGEAPRDRLRAIAEEHGEGVSITASLAVGGPAAEIVKHAAREQVDLIVVGTPGRTGLAHAVMGSVAEAVVRTAPCQVLTIPLHEETAETAGSTDTGAPSAQAAAVAAEAVQRRCLVCAGPADDSICEACATRIRGQALERMIEDEKAGRVGKTG